jgi:hypothetical protein
LSLGARAPARPLRETCRTRRRARTSTAFPAARQRHRIHHITTRPYRLNPEHHHEFYDLRRDPNELSNLIHLDSEEKDRLREWLDEKYETLKGDHRAKDVSDEIDPQALEDLKALGGRFRIPGESAGQCLPLQSRRA